MRNVWSYKETEEIEGTIGNGKNCFSGEVNTEPGGEKEALAAIRELVRKKINAAPETVSDEAVYRSIEELVLKDEILGRADFRSKKRAVLRVFCALRRELDILQYYVDDNDINEIMVNGKDRIFIERGGIVERVPEAFDSEEQIEEVIRRVAAKVHREINELSPIVDARLSDGSRVNAVYKNIALNGPILTIRKFPERRITMSELIAKQSITPEAADFLKRMVRGGMNIFISGGTSSGKTTFLNVLSDFIPKEERVIVIEDSAELQIDGIENVVRMETRNANVQGKGRIAAGELIRTSLRMRPDRIIVGEVRGSEVVDMLQAMNTGHDGSLSTGHGNSPQGMLRRLEAMFLSAAAFPIEAIQAQIAEAIDLIVHLGRLPDKSRRVLEICEITENPKGGIDTNPIYAYRAGRGLTATGNPLKHTEKLQMRGIEE